MRTQQKILETPTTRLTAIDVRVYFTDKRHVHETIMPASKHVQTKSETHRIERYNCLMRHWFRRFKRKSNIVSKSVQMVDLTIALFARFRINCNVFDILNTSDIARNIIIYGKLWN